MEATVWASRFASLLLTDISEVPVLTLLVFFQRFLAWLTDRYTVRECSLYPR